MSFQAMTWAVEKKCASAGQKLVLLMLANCANHQTGQCNPSHKNLAEECSMGISTLKGHIAALEKAGFLKVIHKAIDGVSLPNQYLLNLSDTPSGSGGVGQNLTEGGSESGRGVGQNLATNQEDKPGIEPVIQGERAQAPAAPVFPKLDDLIAEQAEAERQAAQAEADRLAAEQSAEAARLAAEQGDAARAAAAAQAAEKAKAGKPAKAAKSAEPAAAIACPDDVPAEVFADFLTIRKAKRAPLTNTALAGIRREADKAGLSLADALAVCCERGWVGFRADWHSDSGALASAKTARPVAETFRERDERLARERMASFLPSIAARPVARPAAPVRPGTVIDVTPSKTFPSLEA